MKLHLQLVVTTVLAALLGAGWFWFVGIDDAANSREKPRRSSAATRVLIEPLEFVPDRVVVRTVGTGDALKSAAIHPSVAGEVIEVRFRAEQRVRKGAVLVRLDDEHQRLAVRLIQVALRKAQREATRFKRLASSGHASQAKLEAAQAALESASVRLALARADLDDRTVVAPFDGVIGLTEINIGDRVTDDTMIATLDDRSVILVDFTVPEYLAGRMRVGDPVTVSPSTTPDRKITGAIHATGSRIDPKSRSLRVRARIPNDDDAMRPGTSYQVELAFIGKSYPRVRVVAVLWSRDGAYLWRANGGASEKVFVKLVRRDRGRILVDGPLRTGDLIVVEGVQGLRAGQPLDPAPFDADDATRPGAGPASNGTKGPS